MTITNFLPPGGALQKNVELDRASPNESTYATFEIFLDFRQKKNSIFRAILMNFYH